MQGGHACLGGDPKATPQTPFCQHKPQCPCSAQAGTHLEEGDDEGTQWEVGGLLELGVKLLNGERGVLWEQPGLSPCPPLAPQGDALLLLPQFFPISAPLLTLPCSRENHNGGENHAQGFASSRDSTLNHAMQIPGDAENTSSIFLRFRSIQHQ